MERAIRRRVLVVDDNVDASDSLVQMLRLMGHEAEVAYGGRQGVEMARTYIPDVILMDIGILGIDGIEAAREIRSASWGRGVLLVAVTGWGRDDDRRKSADAGFDEHVVKPIDVERLMALIGARAKAITMRKRRL